jgi:integrative and conjugative element protein (TIGR02256 family)
MNSEWTIEVNDYGLVRVSKELIKQLSIYRQLENHTPESGGVLIGKYLNSNGTILIDDFTSPQSSDMQGRFRYYRSDEHNKLVQTIWEKSRYKSTYVGLWHTHAEPIPNYSSIDKKDWINALKNSKYEGNSLFFLIVGQTHIRIWKGTKKTLKSNIELIGEMNVE